MYKIKILTAVQMITIKAKITVSKSNRNVLIIVVVVIFPTMKY